MRPRGCSGLPTPIIKLGQIFADVKALTILKKRPYVKAALQKRTTIIYDRPNDISIFWR